MNDAAEFRMAVTAVSNELTSRAVARESADELARINALFREIGVVETIDVYVLSLTEEGDQLSQWRAYGGRHSGFAVGFNVKNLCRIASQHKYSLERCIYDLPAHELLVMTIVDTAMAWLGHSNRMCKRRCREFRRAMLQVAPTLKHSTFAEEREWRLVSSQQAVTGSSVSFRAGTSTIVPYYKLPIVHEDGTSALTSVTVGPTPHPELAVEAVHALAHTRGFHDVSIEESRIPLRTW